MELKYVKIQELLFELRVEDVMQRNVVTHGPTTTMKDLRATLRDHRISGVPVVAEDNTILGIVSVEDLIRWLSDGGKDCLVSEKMTSNPMTLLADQPVLKAIEMLDSSGFGRLPVIDRATKKLRGIITKGDIIEGVLKKLKSEYEEEEVRHYRASHFFQDIVADRWEIRLTYEIKGKDFDRAGRASTQMKKNLKRLGLHPDVIRRLAIASYEAEMNVVIYADAGVMSFRINPNEVLLTVADEGPGIADLDQAMQEGYSTAEKWVRDMGFGAGMGLPNIKRCADAMSIDSTPGVGTFLDLRFNLPPSELEL